MTRQQQQRDLPCDTAVAAGEHWSVLVSLLSAARTRVTPEFHQRVQILAEVAECLVLVTLSKCQKSQVQPTGECQVDNRAVLLSHDRERSC